MRNPHFALAVLFAITIAVFPGHAQDSSKEAAVSEYVLAQAGHCGLEVI